MIDRFLRHLIDLVLRPEAFFARYSPESMGRITLGLALVCGLGVVIDRFGLAALRQGVPQQGLGFDLRIQPLMESWGLYWGAVTIAALVMAPILYCLGGLWVVLRARFAGAPRPDGRKARALFTFATAIWAGPTIVGAAVDTLVHENFSAALQQRGTAVLLLLVLPFWSIFVGYRGAVTMFPGKPKRMGFWFAGLPLIITAGASVLLFAVPFVQLVRSLAASLNR